MTAIARTRRGDVRLLGMGTLMERCLALGLPVASSCQGQAACGKCIVTVLAGYENLNAPAERESAVLLRNQAEANQRLGCQCIPPTEAPLIITTGYW